MMRSTQHSPQRGALNISSSQKMLLNQTNKTDRSGSEMPDYEEEHKKTKKVRTTHTKGFKLLRSGSPQGNNSSMLGVSDIMN
jgi:hypothetical protein